MGVYTHTHSSVVPYPSMKVVQEWAKEAGKSGGDKPFLNLGLGDFIWAQAIQARLLVTSSYWEASLNLYGMLLCGLEDCLVVETKNIFEECTMWYLMGCDTQLLAHVSHLFEEVCDWWSSCLY